MRRPLGYSLGPGRSACGIGKCKITIVLSVAPAPLSGAFRSRGRRRTIPIVFRYPYRRQWNTVAASGAVVVVALQCHHGYSRLGATLGTRYKCFASCHAVLSFLSQAAPRTENALLPKHIWIGNSLAGKSTDAVCESRRV